MHQSRDCTPEELAKHLLDGQAIQRFQDLIFFWRNLHEIPPHFKVAQTDLMTAAIEHLKLGLKLDNDLAFCRLLSLIAFIQAGKRLDELKPATSKLRPNYLLKQAHTSLGTAISYESFRSRLTRTATLDRNLGGLIAFLPFTECAKVGVRHFEGSCHLIRSHVEQHRHYNELLLAGEELLHSILRNDPFPERIWEVYPFEQDLPDEHRVRLLRVQAPHLPSEYMLNGSGHITTVQPAVPSTPLSLPISPSPADGHGHAGSGDCATTRSTVPSSSPPHDLSPGEDTQPSPVQPAGSVLALSLSGGNTPASLPSSQISAVELGNRWPPYCVRKRFDSISTALGIRPFPWLAL
jgi:hypothetical protein